MTSAGPASGGGTFAPLSVPTFFALWVGTILSNFGTLIQGVGAAWMMTVLAATPSMVALVQTAMSLPIMLLGLPAGALADIYDRRIIMALAQALVVVAATILAIIGLSGGLTPFVLLVLTFVLGAGTALNAPAWQASIGDIVPRSLLPSAVALNSLSFNSARTIGPALGGAIVAWFGAPVAFLLNALATLPLLGLLLRWKPPPRKRDLPTEPMGTAMWIGLRYVSLSQTIREAILRGGVIGFAGGAIWALLPLIARDQHGGGPTLFGALLGAFGAGAIVGVIVGGSLRTRTSIEWQWTAPAIGLAIALMIVGASTIVWVTALALMAAGGFWLLALSMLISRVHFSAPRWVVGRAMAIYQMVFFGALAFGSALWGLVANNSGLTATFCMSGGALLLATLALRLRPLRDVTAGLEPSVEDVATPNLDMQQDTQPVVVTIAYRVPHADTTRFHELMQRVSRMRRRDGALGWELLQDIDAPELWLERFHSRNWHDYQRRRLRATIDDKMLRDEIRDFLIADRSKIRRYVRRTHKAARPPQRFE